MWRERNLTKEKKARWGCSSTKTPERKGRLNRLKLGVETIAGESFGKKKRTSGRKRNFKRRKGGAFDQKRKEGRGVTVVAMERWRFKRKKSGQRESRGRLSSRGPRHSRRRSKKPIALRGRERSQETQRREKKSPGRGISAEFRAGTGTHQ